MAVFIYGVMRLQEYFIFIALLQRIEFGQSVRFSLDAIADLPLLLNEGKQQLDVITANSRTQQYGTCWANAVSDLNVGCRYLTEQLQSELALKLTDCFLQMSGHGAISCLAHRQACLKSLSDREFNAYTEFYTHTQNICYFLQSKLWHQESEKTIDRLSLTSYKVSMQLVDAERGQEALLKQQLKSLNIQENMAQSMETSKDKINSMMEEIRMNAIEQQIALGSLFNQLAILQAWAVGELSWLDSIFFYSSAAILSCLFTSMSRTQRARLPLLLIFTINFGIERYCCSIFNVEPESVVDTSAKLQSWVWFLRKTSTVACIFIWSFVALTYCDYNVVNYQMLVQIRQQNQELLKRLTGRDVPDFSEQHNKPTDTSQLLSLESKLDNSLVEADIEKTAPDVFLTEKEKRVPPDRPERSSSYSTTRASVTPVTDGKEETVRKYSLRRSSRLKSHHVDEFI